MARKGSQVEAQVTDVEDVALAPVEGEVTVAEAMAEDAALAAAEKGEAKPKPAKIVPLATDASYVLSPKGREYADRDDKVTNQRPDADAKGTGKEWYGIAAKRPARRQQVLRVLRDLGAPFTAAEGKAAIAAGIEDGRIGKGSENPHTLLGLCNAVNYFEVV